MIHKGLQGGPKWMFQAVVSGTMKIFQTTIFDEFVKSPIYVQLSEIIKIHEIFYLSFFNQFDM